MSVAASELGQRALEFLVQQGAGNPAQVIRGLITFLRSGKIPTALIPDAAEAAAVQTSISVAEHGAEATTVGLAMQGIPGIQLIQRLEQVIELAPSDKQPALRQLAQYCHSGVITDPDAMSLLNAYINEVLSSNETATVTKLEQTLAATGERGESLIDSAQQTLTDSSQEIKDGIKTSATGHTTQPHVKSSTTLDQQAVSKGQRARARSRAPKSETLSEDARETVDEEDVDDLVNRNTTKHRANGETSRKTTSRKSKTERTQDEEVAKLRRELEQANKKIQDAEGRAVKKATKDTDIDNDVDALADAAMSVMKKELTRGNTWIGLFGGCFLPKEVQADLENKLPGFLKDNLLTDNFKAALKGHLLGDENAASTLQDGIQKKAFSAVKWSLRIAKYVPENIRFWIQRLDMANDVAGGPIKQAIGKIPILGDLYNWAYGLFRHFVVGYFTLFGDEINTGSIIANKPYK